MGGLAALPSSAGEVVARSALTVKLLIYEPTGAVVAAPPPRCPRCGAAPATGTTGTPGCAMPRWPSRRSSAGRYDEAMAFWDRLERAVRQRNDPPATAYTIHAGEVPAEVGLDHLQGFGGARPVRVGNAASDQLQLDVFGHVLEAAAHCYDRMELDRAHPADVLASFADQAASRWSAPDESIWEVRSGPERYVYSTFRCWSALDRAVHLADEGALAGDRRSWAKAREQAAEAVLRDGWNDELGSFSRAIGGDQLDATALAVVAGGLLERDDPRLVSTIRAVEDHLADGALVRRYATDDGLDGQDGAFLLCSSWLADAHLAAGAPDRAAEILEEVEGLANDLGLLSEEVDLSDRSLLGNFPQALSHLGLINSRVKLDEAAANG
ncbi:MAG: glycoside hydrolase family 15 protein [Acidimicrobiales bacterium]